MFFPDQFAVVIDGWGESSTHYLAVFAVFPDKSDAGYSHALLSFSPMLDEEKFTAVFHYESIYEILQLYGKNFSNVACIIGDNCSVNQALARISKCYLVGCASHRLNLGIQRFLITYSDLILSIRSIMVSLRTIKSRAALRKKHIFLQYWTISLVGLPSMKCSNGILCCESILMAL